jgi:hypothetical protein
MLTVLKSGSLKLLETTVTIQVFTGIASILMLFMNLIAAYFENYMT